jgi:putative CRISPR-associated protein (TIGR02619 family)
MRTIIMTVGTSLLNNRDDRPWSGQKTVGDRTQAIAWMQSKSEVVVSAETNTLYRLNPYLDDEIILLHSTTADGKECAEVLSRYFKEVFDQNHVVVKSLPCINYDYKKTETGLEQMAQSLQDLISHANGDVTLAATGGFKAQTMVMALIGNKLGIPVCYIHEEFKGLVYIPYIGESGQFKNEVIRRARIPASGVDRDSVLQVRSDQQEPNRPRSWQKVKEMIIKILWVEKVYYDERAYRAPENNAKGATVKTPDGRNILWMRLTEGDRAMAIAIETTGRNPEQLCQSLDELNERLGRLF